MAEGRKRFRLRPSAVLDNPLTGFTRHQMSGSSTGRLEGDEEGKEKELELTRRIAGSCRLIHRASLGLCRANQVSAQGKGLRQSSRDTGQDAVLLISVHRNGLGHSIENAHLNPVYRADPPRASGFESSVCQRNQAGVIA